MPGCLLRLCWNEPTVARWGRRFGSLLGQSAAVVGLGLTLVLQLRFREHFMLIAGYTAQGILVCALIAGLQHQDGAFRRVLEWRVLTHLGVVSYSLYLWQQIFTLPVTSVAWMSRLPVALVGPLLIAEMSWFAMERPLAQLRHRISAF